MLEASYYGVNFYIRVKVGEWGSTFLSLVTLCQEFLPPEFGREMKYKYNVKAYFGTLSRKLGFFDQHYY